VGFDVLAWRPVRGLLRWSGFPVLLQAAACVVVLWIAAVGLGVGAGMPSEDLMTLRKTNLATLVVWGLWWPGMILVALLLGRVWCTVCPMELLNRIGETVGRRVGWRGLRLGGFLRAGWMTVALYLVLQILVAGMSLHRVPHYTAVMVLALAGGRWRPVSSSGSRGRSAGRSVPRRPCCRSTAGTRRCNWRCASRPSATAARRRTARGRRTGTGSTGAVARRS
jgi:hypothetical protein